MSKSVLGHTAGLTLGWCSAWVQILPFDNKYDSDNNGVFSGHYCLHVVLGPAIQVARPRGLSLVSPSAARRMKDPIPGQLWR